MHPLLQQSPAARCALVELDELTRVVVDEVERSTPQGWDERLHDDNGREVSLMAEALRWVAGETSHRGAITATRPLVRRYPADVVRWRDRSWSDSHRLRRPLRDRLVRYVKDQGGFGGRPARPACALPADDQTVSIVIDVCGKVSDKHGLDRGELVGQAWEWLCARPDHVNQHQLLRTSLFMYLEREVVLDLHATSSDVLSRGDRLSFEHLAEEGFDVTSDARLTTTNGTRLPPTTFVTGLRDAWDQDLQANSSTTRCPRSSNTPTHSHDEHTTH